MTAPSARHTLELLGGLRVLCDDDEISVPETVERLLVYLALTERPVARAKLAGALWPDASEKQALGSLRSTLWRLHGPMYDMVDVQPKHLALADTVEVDYRTASLLAQRIIDLKEDVSETDLDPASADALSLDLLPDWYEEWAGEEAEKWHQLRLHGLEALGIRLMAMGRFADAMTAALSAVAADPLRESSRNAVIRIHLAEGNRSEAIREYDRYSITLRENLGIEPTQGLQELVVDEVRLVKSSDGN